MTLLDPQAGQLQRSAQRAPPKPPCHPPGRTDPRDFDEFQGQSDFPGRVSPIESMPSMASEASTLRFPSAVHKFLHRLRQASEALHSFANQGSKLIAANLVELRYALKELGAAVEAAELQGEFPEAVRAETEDLLEATPALSPNRTNWKVGGKTKEFNSNNALNRNLAHSPGNQRILTFFKEYRAVGSDVPWR